MDVLRSAPLAPVPWWQLLGAMGALWLAPVALGLAGLGAFAALGRVLQAETGYALWFGATALALSPAFSWIGWLIALPAVALALSRGWFGWLTAALIGAIAGSVAGAIAETTIALPFGLLALLALRGVLGRFLPL